MVVKVKDAKTTRKQSKCSAYDNTKKARLYLCSLQLLLQLEKVKAESEAERSDYQVQKNLQYAGDDRKDRKKKHDKNERED